MQLTNYKYIKNQKPKYDNGEDNRPPLYQQGSIQVPTQNQLNGLSFNAPQFLGEPKGTLTWDNMPSKYYNTKGIISFNQPSGNKGLRFEDVPGPEYGIRDNIQMPSSSQLNGIVFNKPEHFETKPGSGNGGAAKGTSSTGSSWDPTSALMSTANFVGDVFSAYNRPVANASELASQAGTSYGNVGGVQYQRQNAVDVDQAVQNAKEQGNQGTMSTAIGGLSAGAAIGSIGGPLGAGIGAVVGGLGGLLFGNSAKRRAMKRAQRQAELAQRMATNTNIFNRAQAQSDLMGQQYMQKYGNTQGGILYANKGKDMPMYNSGKDKVWSPDGYVSGLHNSYVGKGEVIANFNSGKASVITKGKVGVDNQKSSVSENDDNIILGNDVDFTTGRTFAEQGRPYADKLHFINQSEKKVGKYGKLSSLSKNTQNLYKKQISSTKQQLLDGLKDISDRQAEQHNYENDMRQYAHFASGKWLPYMQMAMPSITGIADGIGRYISANKQNIENGDTYYRNPYAQRALQGLAGLRYDVDSELRQYANQQAYNKYAIDQQGGLTAGQKYIAKNSLYNDYMNNVAKLYANANNINNQYKAQYYDQLMKAGEAERSALTAARRYDADIYAKARAAQLNMANQARKDALENLYRMDKRFADYKMWKDTNRIYEQDMTNKKQDVQNSLNIARETAASNERIARMMNNSNRVVTNPMFYGFTPNSLYNSLDFNYKKFKQ